MLHERAKARIFETEAGVEPLVWHLWEMLQGEPFSGWAGAVTSPLWLGVKEVITVHLLKFCSCPILPSLFYPTSSSEFLIVHAFKDAHDTKYPPAELGQCW